MVIVTIACVAVSLILVLGVILSLLQGRQSPVPRGLAHAVLNDGSVLVVHDVAIDSTQITLSDPSDSIWVRLGLESAPEQTFSANTSHDSRLVVWLARYDGATGRPLPFDRWSHSIARTGDGYGTVDADFASRSTRMMAPHSSTSSTSSRRPFEPLEPGNYSHILYASGFPLIRPRGSEFDVEIHDVDAGLVAVLRVPYPETLPPRTEPVPESLPITATDGEVAVTLNTIRTRTFPDPAAEPVRSRVGVELEYDVQQNGRTSDLWGDGNFSLRDGLGNESYRYDCRLSPREPAWIIDLRLFQKNEAAILQGDRLIAEDLTLPDEDPATTPNGVPVNESVVIEGVAISLLGIGGPGPASYSFRTAQTGRSTHSYGDDLSTEYDPPNGVLQIDRDDRHVAVHVVGMTQDHRLSLLIADQNGVLLGRQPVHRQMGETHVYSFETDEWVTDLNVYLTLRRARRFEFTVVPPEFPASESVPGATPRP